MPDYSEMYFTLYRSVTKAIDLLQEAQRATEEMYISADSADIIELTPENQEEQQQTKE